jgi:FtsP/CotA-like multicopper oxidase with cupredoxin domain
MYHSHHDEMTQMALGMMGMIVVHPRRPSAGYAVDRDFAIMLSEWAIVAGASRPDPNEMMDFNVLTINAKRFPGTAPLVVPQGRSRADPLRQPLGDGPPLRSTCTGTTSRSSPPTAVRSR